MISSPQDPLSELQDELFLQAYSLIRENLFNYCRSIIENISLEDFKESAKRGYNFFKEIYDRNDPAESLFYNEDLLNQLKALSKVEKFTEDTFSKTFIILIFPCINQGGREIFIPWVPQKGRSLLGYPYNNERTWECLYSLFEKGVQVDEKSESGLKSARNHYVKDLEKIDGRSHREADRTIGIRSVRYVPLRLKGNGKERTIAAVCICSPLEDISKFFPSLKVCTSKEDDYIYSLIYRPAEFLKWWVMCWEATQRQKIEDWIDLTAGLSHSLTNYLRGITEPLGYLVQDFSHAFNDEEWQEVEEKVKAGYIRERVMVDKLFEPDTSLSDRRKEINKIIATVGFATKAGRYASMFANFWEAFAKESKIRREGKRRIQEIHRVNLLRYIEEAERTLKVIESFREGSEDIQERFSIAIDTAEWDEKEVIVYYDDLAPLLFTFYELLKNAYLHLKNTYGTNRGKYVVDISFRKVKRSEKEPFEKVKIVFENVCPFTDEKREIFNKIKRRHRLSTVGGSGLGLFCCRRFLEDYYYGRLTVDLKPPDEDNGEGKAVFEVIIPRDLREIK